MVNGQAATATAAASSHPIIDIDHGRARLDGVGGLMGAGRGGQAAAEVKELPDAGARHIGEGAGLELAAFAGQVGGAGVDRQQFFGLLAVGGEIVFAAQ